MKRIVLVSVFAAAAVGAGYGIYPDECAQSIDVAANALLRVWANIEANPFPVLIALITFVATVVYHKAKGKSLRESVEAATTRVTVVTVPSKQTEDQDNPILQRAKARAMRAQLLVDQIGLQNRQRKLPDEIIKAEKEACYTQQDLSAAEAALSNRRKAHDDAVAKLEALRKENQDRGIELVEIEEELKKLAKLI
jgi:hypothetical protein